MAARRSGQNAASGKTAKTASNLKFLSRRKKLRACTLAAGRCWQDDQGACHACVPVLAISPLAICFRVFSAGVARKSVDAPPPLCARHARRAAADTPPPQGVFIINSNGKPRVIKCYERLVRGSAAWRLSRLYAPRACAQVLCRLGLRAGVRAALPTRARRRWPAAAPTQNEDQQQAVVREIFSLLAKRSDAVCNFLEGGRCVRARRAHPLLAACRRRRGGAAATGAPRPPLAA
jgi:hypothetical protein